MVRAGIGIQSGQPARITLEPAPFGSGLCFRTAAGPVRAWVGTASCEPGATVLRAGSAGVRTPEHLLAALAALGVTDAGLWLEGPEVPALDGSALGWVDAIDEAGRRDGPGLRVLRPSSPIRVDDGAASASFSPGPARLEVEVDFPDGPRGSLEVPMTEGAFRSEIAWARTFVLARDVERLRALGRGAGAGPDNTVVWPDGPFRSADEVIRHKALDAWGDLALLGPFEATVRVVRGSHALHHALLGKILAASPHA